MIERFSRALLDFFQELVQSRGQKAIYVLWGEPLSRWLIPNNALTWRWQPKEGVRDQPFEKLICMEATDRLLELRNHLDEVFLVMSLVYGIGNYLDALLSEGAAEDVETVAAVRELWRTRVEKEFPRNFWLGSTRDGPSWIAF